MTEPLDGNRIIVALIQPKGSWTRIDVLEEVDSTNAQAARGPGAWRLLAAAAQSAGRGRHARGWSSPAGGSVAVSMTVPLPAPPVDRGLLPLLTGLAVRDGLIQLTGPEQPTGPTGPTGLPYADDGVAGGTGSLNIGGIPDLAGVVGAGRQGAERVAADGRFALKWPNDVLQRAREAGEPGVAGRESEGKVAGILCQLLPGDLVVAGVGVNVDITPADLPVATATSLAAHAAPPAREDVVVAVARAFARRYAQWADPDRAGELLADYRAACATLGREVAVHLPRGEVVRGRAVDVDGAGRLVLAVQDAENPTGPPLLRVFAAGDVVHVRGDQQASSRYDTERGER